MSIYLTPNSQGEPEPDLPSKGEFQLREAASTIAQKDSYEAKMDKVRAACMREFSDTPGPGYGPYDGYGPTQSAYVERTYDDCVIFRKGPKLFVVDFTVDSDMDVTFGTPEEIEPTYTKVKGGDSVSSSKK